MSCSACLRRGVCPGCRRDNKNLQERFPATDIFSHIEVADGRAWLKRDGVPSFAGDLPEEEQKCADGFLRTTRARVALLAHAKP